MSDRLPTDLELAIESRNKIKGLLGGASLVLPLTGATIISADRIPYAEAELERLGKEITRLRRLERKNAIPKRKTENRL